MEKAKILPSAVWNKFEATPAGAVEMTGVLVGPPTRNGECAGKALTAKGPDLTI